jgi:hypothetical protein
MLKEEFDEPIPDEVITNIDEIADLIGNKKCLYDFLTEKEKKILPDV